MIIISKEELCSVYTHVTNDELIAVSLVGDGNLRSLADDKGDVMHCILDEAGVIVRELCDYNVRLTSRIDS